MHYVLKLALPAAVAAVLSAGPLYAQNAKTFVASTGDDANACNTEAVPCRTIIGAHGKTNANGIIYCLDNGEFSGGATTFLSKSITVDCAGTGGSIKANGTAITIQGAATDVIQIRGLKIHTFDNSIRIENTGRAASVRIEDCDFVSFGTVVPVVQVGGVQANANVIEVLIARTTISGGPIGILVHPDGGGARVTLDDVRVFNSGIGIDARGTTATTAPNLRLSVKNSTISGNTNQGIRAASTNGLTRVFVTDTMVTQNGTGLQVDGIQAAFHVAGSKIIHNGIGLSALNSGLLFSFGNNVLTLHTVAAGSAFTNQVPLK